MADASSDSGDLLRLSSPKPGCDHPPNGPHCVPGTAQVLGCVLGPRSTDSSGYNGE